MAIPPRTRRRVLAIPRAADGSAFKRCDRCKNSVPIALIGMHACGLSQRAKRFRGIPASVEMDYVDERFFDQPRSAFRFFMEEFTAMSKIEDPIKIDRNGFEKWKNMSDMEREPYIRKANYVNLHYDKALRNEEDQLRFSKYKKSKSGVLLQPEEKKKPKVSLKSDSKHEWFEDSGDSDCSKWLIY